MSWMSPLDAEREKLEGLPLTVCNDCKEMVLQVGNARQWSHTYRNDVVE